MIFFNENSFSAYFLADDFEFFGKNIFWPSFDLEIYEILIEKGLIGQESVRKKSYVKIWNQPPKITLKMYFRKKFFIPNN